MLYVQKLILFLPRGAKVDQKGLAVRQESKLEERHHQEASLWLNLSHHGKNAPMASYWDRRFLQYGVV